MVHHPLTFYQTGATQKAERLKESSSSYRVIQPLFLNMLIYEIQFSWSEEMFRPPFMATRLQMF